MSDGLLELRRIHEWKTNDILFAIARVGGSERRVVGSSDFQVYEVEEVDGKLERKPFEGDAHQSYVTSLAIAGNFLVSGSYDGRLIWWDLAERKAVRAIAAHERWIRRVIAAPDGQRVVSVADDMQCKIWDAVRGDAIRTCSDHAAETPHHFPSMLYATAISPDGRWLATGDKVGHVAIWDMATGEKVGVVEAPGMYTWDPRQRIHSIGGIRSLAFSPDGEQLAVGGIGEIGNIDHLGGPSRVEIFAWRSAERLHVISDDKFKGLVEQIVWRPQGEQMHLLCVGGDHKGFLSLWNAASGELVQQTGTDGHIHALACDATTTILDIACHQRLERWEIAAKADNPDPAS